MLIGCGIVLIAGYWGWHEYHARRAWDAAQAALARRDLEAAARQLDRYLRYRPDDPSGLFLAARTARRLARYPEAKRLLATYESRGGSTEAIQLERDLLLVQQGIIGEADYRLRAVVGPDHPDAALVLEALAKGYLVVERWADARQACALWRRVEPDHPLPWLWGGWVCERLVQLESAQELYEQAVRLAPDDRDARLALARILLQLRRPGEATAHYEQVLARRPDDTEALLGLAQCRLESGLARQAVPILERVLEAEPDSGLTHVLRGRVYLETDEPVAAEPHLRRAVELEPADATALHLLTLSLRAQGKDEEAERLTARLVRLQDDLRRLTELLRKIGPGPGDGPVCHEAGVIALRIGRTRQGLNLLHDALRRQGDHRATHAVLADYYRRVGKSELAVAHQNLAEGP